jgi:hypothetical protein
MAKPLGMNVLSVPIRFILSRQVLFSNPVSKFIAILMK